jgi:hypothetical protein
VDEGLRRAFEVQMRLVEEVRRELEVAEARRLRDRDGKRGARVVLVVLMSRGFRDGEGGDDCTKV